MEIHFSYENFDESKCDKGLEDYLSEKKVKSIARFLKQSDLDLADLEIRAEYLAHHKSFLVKFNLKIAKHVLFAEETKHILTKAFDMALAKLISQLRRLESIRHKK